MTWLARAYPGLLDVKARADAGGYADDRVSLRERRRAFLAWLVAHGKVAMD